MKRYTNWRHSSAEGTAEDAQISIDEISILVCESLKQLSSHDWDLLVDNANHAIVTYDNSGQRERPVHEISLCHRMAVYLEKLIEESMPRRYRVDIEYNRYYDGPKIVKISESESCEVRPDIVIHSRMNRMVSPQHLLVVEAKKGEISHRDIVKVKAFMLDTHYLYKYGMTVSFCIEPNAIIATLYHRNEQGQIVERPIRVEYKERSR